MTEDDALAALEREFFPASMTEAERQHFENLLVLRAYVRAGRTIRSVSRGRPPSISGLFS